MMTMVNINEIETRPAGPSDADDMARAHRDSIRSIGPAFYPPYVVDDWEEGVSRQMYVNAIARGEVFFIATGRVDGHALVLGFASDYCIEGSTHGASVYVRGFAARRGIGTALFRLAEAHAAANGAMSIQIEASLAGVAFYEANGFVEVGRGEIDLRSGRPIACVFMVKELRGAAALHTSDGVDPRATCRPAERSAAAGFIESARVESLSRGARSIFPIDAAAPRGGEAGLTAFSSFRSFQRGHQDSLSRHRYRVAGGTHAKHGARNDVRRIGCTPSRPVGNRRAAAG